MWTLPLYRNKVGLPPKFEIDYARIALGVILWKPGSFISFIWKQFILFFSFQAARMYRNFGSHERGGNPPYTDSGSGSIPVSLGSTAASTTTNQEQVGLLSFNPRTPYQRQIVREK